MDTRILTNIDEFPRLLRQINDPPKKLFVQGTLPSDEARVLCVVGAREYSSYGEEACRKLILGLRGNHICIVSGLAIGIDSIAHRSALEAGLHTIAFPGSGLDPKVLYPARHAQLAKEILSAGGALISELEMDQEAAPWTFPKRNRLMAGSSHAVLIVEAEMKSGTLITARCALDYNRDVGIVPGSIFSSLSEGPHSLLVDGAIPIRSSEDILRILGLRVQEQSQPAQKSFNFSLYPPEEQTILKLLSREALSKDSIVQESELSASHVNIHISSLEIQGVIEEKNGIFKIVS